MTTEVNTQESIYVVNMQLKMIYAYFSMLLYFPVCAMKRDVKVAPRKLSVGEGIQLQMVNK